MTVRKVRFVIFSDLHKSVIEDRHPKTTESQRPTFALSTEDHGAPPKFRIARRWGRKELELLGVHFSPGEQIEDISEAMGWAKYRPNLTDAQQGLFPPFSKMSYN